MKRLIIIKNVDMNSEMILPVTPADFEVSHGVDIQTVNIYTLGDVAIVGYPTLASIKLNVMFPAQYYPFCNFRNSMEPYYYVKAFQQFADNRANLRFIVSGTPVNIPVKTESIDPYGEKDGTNDVYATITLQEMRELQAVQVQTTAKSANASRAVSSAPVSSTQSYKIVSGDTLSAIARKFYGNASLYGKLATYNGIKNPSLIHAGTTIKIPPASQLR